MTERTNSLLFLMEQLIVITVFAVCAAVCVSVFVSSRETAVRTAEINNASHIAASGAEAFKSAGNPEELAALLDGNVSAGGVTVGYDAGWLVCGEGAAYLMNIGLSQTSGANPLTTADISVSTAEGESIFAITAAARWAYE